MSLDSWSISVIMILCHVYTRESRHSGSVLAVLDSLVASRAPTCRMLLFSITLGLIFANMSPKVVFKSYMPQVGARDVTA